MGRTEAILEGITQLSLSAPSLQPYSLFNDVLPDELCQEEGTDHNITLSHGLIKMLMYEKENVHFFRWTYAEEGAELIACTISTIFSWINTFKMLYHNIFRVLDIRLSFLLHVKACCAVVHLFSLIRKLV